MLVISFLLVTIVNYFKNNNETRGNILVIRNLLLNEFPRFLRTKQTV